MLMLTLISCYINVNGSADFVSSLLHGNDGYLLEQQSITAIVAISDSGHISIK
jgi:hypothetical protein